MKLLKNFYAKDKNRYFHFIWHLFVLAGSAKRSGCARPAIQRRAQPGGTPAWCCPSPARSPRRGLSSLVGLFHNGLGDNFQTIAAHCEAFKSEHVQAFTLVINPNPDLIAFIPEGQREDFVRQLT